MVQTIASVASSPARKGFAAPSLGTVGAPPDASRGAMGVLAAVDVDLFLIRSVIGPPFGMAVPHRQATQAVSGSLLALYAVVAAFAALMTRGGRA